MHGVTVSCPGKLFSQPRCSISRENKSRIRRTKEERRTMVLSFIKKYQSSNNGKFPSLNLTHKEVGGSFYTIREIVRDIIQENKVLGPGNPSSKLLNLEYYSEEEADKGCFLNVHGNISISAIGNGIDQVHHEVESSTKEQEVSSEEIIAVIKPVTQVMFKTDLNENSSWQVKHAEPSLQEVSANGSVHEKLVNTGMKESNVHSLTAKKDDASGSDDQINQEFQPNIPEDIGIQYAKQSVSLYPIVSGTSLVESELKNKDKHNKISVAKHYLEESNSISETTVTGSLPGSSIFFMDIVDDQSNCCAEHDTHGVLPLVADTLDPGSSSETAVLALSNTSQISSSAHQMHLPFELFEKGAAINSSGLETAGLNSTFSTSKTSSSANKGSVPFISIDKEPIIRSAKSRESASSSESGIDVAEGKSGDNFALRTIISHAPGATENEEKLVDKSSSFVEAVKESENASSILVKPIIQEADHSDFKSEKRSDAFSTVNGGGFMSSANEKAKEESETSDTNPFVAAIKEFVSSFIKFWSE